MNEQEQIRAIAEMDGFNPEPELAVNAVFGKAHNKPKWSFINQLPPYLTSRDAIVPVIENQKWVIRILTLESLMGYNCSGGLASEEAVKAMLATPAQLCEALLRATGKWKP